MLPFCKFAQCMLSQNATGKEEVGKERNQNKKENELTLSLWGKKNGKEPIHLGNAEPFLQINSISLLPLEMFLVL